MGTIKFASDIFKRKNPQKPSRLEDIATTEKENCTKPNNKNPKHLVTNVSVYYPSTLAEKRELRRLGYRVNYFGNGKTIILETCLECQKLISVTIRD